MFFVSVLSALLLLLAGASDFANCQSFTLNLAYIAANKNTPNNCWILITNYIYDMTQYIDLHPAGPTYITNNCGKDASAAYNGQNAHAKVSPIANIDGIINMGRVGTVITPTTAPTTPVPTTKPATTKPPTLPAGGGGTTITLSLAYIAANRALPGNCWVAISSYVYDLSAYVHGGGASYINANCGKDATAAYQAQPSFHQTTSVPMPPKAGITRMGVLGSTITIGGGGVTTVIPTLPPTSAPTQGGGGGTTTVTLNANYVAQKNTATNCWIILNNNVYDMSKYAHPGGASFITSNCGKDATTAYLAQTVHTPTKLTKTQGLVLVGAVGTSIQVVTLTANYIAQYRATPNSNCWIIISNNVYDMTTYASKHGGGQAFVNGQCGKDATTAYTGQAGVHTPTQLATKTILIGTVGATVPLVAGSGSGPATQAPPATLPPNTGGSGVKKTVTLTPDYIKSTRSNSGVSCWIIFNNYVFDLTQYSHPAGASYITGACGSDATGAYTGQAAHSFTRLPTATAVGTSSAGTILYKGAVGDSIQIDSNDQGSASGKMATKSWVQNNTIAFVCIVVAVGGLITLVVLHLASSWYHRRRLARDANTKSNLAMANRV